jgi:ssDNA-binding Zn-finger/Zn-ribbon topoisomerase 1
MSTKQAWAASGASRRATAIAKLHTVVEALYPGAYDMSQFEYLGAHTPTTVICKAHGPFTTKPTYLTAGSGCPTCGKQRTAAASAGRKLGAAGFAAKAAEIHGACYDYSKVVYVGNKDKVEIVCKEHGPFWQNPNGHLGGKGCPECANDGKRARNAAVSAALAGPKLAALRAMRPEYDFSRAAYVGSNKKIEVLCPQHGAFWASVDNMLVGGTGCPRCGRELVRAHGESRRTTQEEWVARATLAHRGKYDYSISVYKGDKQHIQVICAKHGQFTTRTDGHIYDANGCPKCSHHESKQETRIAEYLSMFTPVVSRDRTILKPKELDIYLPEKKLAIEYCGMYWHSYFNAEDNLAGKNKHSQKHLLCAEQGIRLLTIYESEWEEREPAIRRLLRNAVGKGRGKLMARKCELRKVATADARDFYERYHPQGGAGSGEHYGLYWNGKLVACMRFSFGQNDRGVGAANRVWTLGRYATRVTVAGAASRLFKAFVQEHNPQEVKSFSDNRYFSGGMYTQLGFTLEQEVAPDYQVWSPKIGLRPKSHYQRRQLPQRLREHNVTELFDPETDPRAESDMTYLMGCGRIYDCGKKRWVWHVAPTPQTE